MPAVDDPFSIAASLPGQMATLKGQLKDLSVNNTQALTQALAAATAASNAANAAATAAYNAAIAPRVGSAGTNSYTLSTSYATYAAFNFTVPTGFTQVYINAGGSVTAFSNAAAGEIGYARILINGSAGTEGRAGFTATQGAASVPAFAVLSIGGLGAGATILIEIQCRLLNGPGSSVPPGASASVSGTALFFR